MTNLSQDEIAYPDGLILGQDAAFYGCGSGGTWRLSSSASGKPPWNFRVIDKNLCGYKPPVGDRSLNLYAVEDHAGQCTRSIFGDHRCGQVVRLSPPAAGQTNWRTSILYQFKGDLDGDYPVESVTGGPNGVLYGVTSAGGGDTTTECQPDGCGAVYKLTSRNSGQVLPWNKATLHTFTDAPDGALQVSTLTPMILPDGTYALFGATRWGGAYGHGTIYEIIP